MDERQWLVCTDPQAMLDFLQGMAEERDSWPPDRKVWLLAIACCRSGWHLRGGDRRFRDAVEEAEQYAAGEVGPPEVRNALRRGLDPLWEGRAQRAYRTDLAFFIRTIQGGVPLEPGVRVTLTRDIFGNPFRPASILPAWRAWGGGLVVALAQAAYDNRQLPSGHLDPARLAVLADALEEAGCSDAGILDHLRGPGPHVRGCDLLDAILAKG